MNFNEFELQDVLDIQWGDSKTTKSSYVPFGYRAYSASGPDGFLVKFDYEEDGVVLSAIGANCGVTYFASGKWSCIKNTIRILKRSDEIDLAYFYYMTKAQDFWELRGSAQPFISQTDIRQKRVRVPDRSGQRYISSTLQSLDDAIVANGEMSQTLESIAQALFRSWFVDFDPVQAKKRGENPVGMDDATAALFPDSMEESELGDIPAGWEVTSVGEFCPLKYGKSLPAPQRQPGSVSVYGSNGTVGVHSVSLLEAPAVVIGRKGTVGSVTLSLDPCWVIDTAFYCAPERGENLPLAYLSLQRLGLENMNSDAAVPGLNRENAHRLLFIIANEPIRARFAEIVGSTFAKIHSIQAEVDSLVSIRDTLLPRLISGQLQVPEDLVA